MRSRQQLREILEDIDATIPEARKRHADEVEFLAEVRNMVQFAMRSVDPGDSDWMIA